MLSSTSDWLNDESIFSVYRDDTIRLFNKLQQNKEVQYVTSGTLATGLGAARLPDLESSPPSTETCLEHVSDIIDAQQKERGGFLFLIDQNNTISPTLQAVMRAVADSEFGSILNKRQVTVARVLQAAADSSEQIIRKSQIVLAKRKMGETSHDQKVKGTKNENAMMVLAVKTGLQLAFRLLKHSADSEDTSLVCDTLETAKDTLLSLPALSLAPSTSASDLQNECLAKTEQVRFSCRYYNYRDSSSSLDGSGRLPLMSHSVPPNFYSQFLSSEAP